MIARSPRKQSSVDTSRAAQDPHAAQLIQTEHDLGNGRSRCPQDAPPGDLLAEGLITLSQATKYCPRRQPGRKVHTTTLSRWGRWGIRGVRLEIIDTPSGLCTSLPALRRFLDRLSAARDIPRPRPEPLVSAEQHEAVEAELARRFRI